MRLLSIDLGTTTAYCYGDTEKDWPEEIGTWDLGEHPKEDVETRWTRRWHALDKCLYTHRPEPEMVAFERVHAQGMNGEFFYGLQSVVRIYAYDARILFTHRSNSEIKLWLAGKGGAQKWEMAAAAEERWGVERVGTLSHDEVDALALFFLIREELA